MQTEMDKISQEWQAARTKARQIENAAIKACLAGKMGQDEALSAIEHAYTIRQKATQKMSAARARELAMLIAEGKVYG